MTSIRSAVSSPPSRPGRAQSRWRCRGRGTYPPPRFRGFDRIFANCYRFWPLLPPPPKGPLDRGGRTGRRSVAGYSRAVPLVRPLIVLIAALSLFAAFAGIASANKAVDSYCSPTGDWCQGVFREGGHIKFRIDTFSFRGPYKLCVKPPKEPRECRTFKLVHKSGGIYGSKIDFARNFSHRRNGRYAVSCIKKASISAPSCTSRRGDGRHRERATAVHRAGG